VPPERASTIAARLAGLLAEPARRAEVIDVRIGLGYTAVRLTDDRVGVAYTFREDATGGCAVFTALRPLAGRPAGELLALLESRDPVEAAVGLACANALANHSQEALDSGDILDHLDLAPGDHVGMVGQFGPLLAPLEARVRALTVFEQVPRPTGRLRPVAEAPGVLPSCQVALITATAIINHTVDGLLEAARGCREVVLLGASTPLVPAVFAAGPVTVLSGVLVERPDGILQVVSEGGGMRQFRSQVRKVNLPLRDA